MDYEIIKMDAELETCPETGVRYFGYVKYRDATSKDVYWHSLDGGFGDTPWFNSQESVISAVESHGYPNVLQVIILKADLPIKKLVVDDG